MKKCVEAFLLGMMNSEISCNIVDICKVSRKAAHQFFLTCSNMLMAQDQMQ